MRFSQWMLDQWRSGYRFRIIVITCLAVILITLLFPFETTTVPQWNLRVVDDAGAPVREINVTEHWQNQLLESAGHEEAQTTNQDGLVNFGARNIRATLLRRAFARLSKFGSAADRGRPVPQGSVVVWGNKNYETTVATYQGEETPPSEIRVLRLR